MLTQRDLQTIAGHRAPDCCFHLMPPVDRLVVVTGPRGSWVSDLEFRLRLKRLPGLVFLTPDCKLPPLLEIRRP